MATHKKVKYYAVPLGNTHVEIRKTAEKLECITSIIRLPKMVLKQVYYRGGTVIRVFNRGDYVLYDILGKMVTKPMPLTQVMLDRILGLKRTQF